MGRSVVSSAPAWAREVQSRVEQWRGSKTVARMPEPLWEAAVRLARKHGVNRVAWVLRLDYYSLKRRVVGHEKGGSPSSKVCSPRFVEVDLSGAFAGTGCVVVMEHPSGARMTLRFSGSEGIDLAALTASFWSQES